MILNLTWVCITIFIFGVAYCKAWSRLYKKYPPGHYMLEMYAISIGMLSFFAAAGFIIMVNVIFYFTGLLELMKITIVNDIVGSIADF